MTDPNILDFHPFNDPTPDIDHDDATCHCPPGGDQYLLAIDASSVHLTHTVCGKPVGDWAEDAINLPATPVTLKWTVEKDRWSGEVEDAWADLTINGQPAPTPTGED